MSRVEQARCQAFLGVFWGNPPLLVPKSVGSSKACVGKCLHFRARLSSPRQFGLGCGEAGDGHAVGRATHVVQARFMAEADRGRFAAVLPANAHF